MDAGDDAVDGAFMRVALLEGAAALAAREVPVGCVFARGPAVLARAHNATNATFDPTRHAEMVALDALSAHARAAGAAACAAPGAPPPPLAAALRAALAPATLYVTVEPCLMCAAALRRAGVGRVVYGARNEKFGGAGTVLDVLGAPAAAPRDGAGDAPPPAVRAGVRADEAVALLKRFYKRANPAAPGAGGGGGGAENCDSGGVPDASADGDASDAAIEAAVAAAVAVAKAAARGADDVPAAPR